MNKNFEVESKVRSKLFIVFASILSAIVIASTDELFIVIALGVFLAICKIVYHKVIRKNRSTSVELFNDRMIFGKDVFNIQDVKRINLLNQDLKIIYGKSNKQFRYAFKEGTREEVCEILRAYSKQNDISLLGFAHTDGESKMVFDPNKFTEFYEKEHSFLISRDKRNRASVGMVLGLILLFSIFLEFISPLLESLTLSFDIEKMIATLIILVPFCITLSFNIFWRLMRVWIKEKREEQRQYFDCDNLKVEIFGKKKTFEKYCVQKSKIEKVLAADHYIEVYGEIDCEIHSSKGIDKKIVDCVKIPRCFTNEEQILSLGNK